LCWGEVELLSDLKLISIFEFQPSGNPLVHVQPKYAKLSKELRRRGVTMQLFWYEYQDQCHFRKTDGYQVTQFKKYFNKNLIQNQSIEVV
jgi:hypothetical protein